MKKRGILILLGLAVSGLFSLFAQDSIVSADVVLKVDTLKEDDSVSLKEDSVVISSDTLIVEEDSLLLDSLERLSDSLFLQDSILPTVRDSILPLGKDSLLIDHKMHTYDPMIDSKFRPKEDRALWYAALIPGLGQIYNRKYWKLPIVFGTIIGLTYGVAWNATQYSQYSTAYKDLKSGDPNAKSYMDMFPIGTKEEDIDKSWLENTLKSYRDYYRNDRDLCIICLILAYGVTVLDAYVDSALFYFDISPNLAMNMSPKVLQVGREMRDLALGLSCSFTF